MSALDRLRTCCSCCEGVAASTPEGRFNRPRLSQIDYRVGTHGRFRDSMVAGISTKQGLAALTTRSSDDWTLALVDSWAVLLDVLTFYQERIANEGFLATATERRSLVELARLVGYEPRPGVAATTHLAFRVSAPPSPDLGGPVRPRAVVLPPHVEVPAGTRAQSTPGPGEQPQPFETAVDLSAHQEWNELRPRQTSPQLFHRGTRRFHLAGTSTGLAVGDWVLVNAPQRSDPDDPGEVAPQALEVAALETDDERGWTEVRLLPKPTLNVFGFDFTGFLSQLVGLPPAVFGGGAATSLQTLGQQHTLTGFEMVGLETLYGLGPGQLGKLLNASPPQVEPPAGAGFFALRVSASVFGHNAAQWKTLPHFWRSNKEPGEGGIDDELAEPGTPPPPFLINWDQARPRVDQGSQGHPYNDEYGGDDPILLLERDFPEVLAGSWLVLRATGKERATAIFEVTDAAEVSRADFGLSGKSTRLAFADAGSGVPDAEALREFTFRETVVHTASEQLELARVPYEDDVGGLSVELERVLEAQLEAGRLVAVSGVRTDEGGAGLEASEIAVVAGTETQGGFTRVVFASELRHTYRRETVTLNANVVPASHGESRRQVLGSGSAATPFQRFELAGKPLTHVSSEVPSGAESTLDLRVRGILWHEAPDFYRLGPDERRYVLRRGDDGTTRVHFGDGVHGARLPTGADNVSAAYRVGIGLDGHVDAGRVSMLSTRPLGVDEVVNPVPARGGEDPEPRDALRTNAPLTVRTLDRIVSLDDFADYARAFSGIGKAHAARVWDGERWVIHVTLAAADGGEVQEDLQAKLRGSMDAAREPHAPLVLGSFRLRHFVVEARLEVHPDHVEQTVVTAADAALHDAFSFTARDLGQRVASSDVIAVLHAVPGVVAVDLDRFQRQGPAISAEVARHLDAQPAGLVSSGGKTVLAGTELLLLAPGPVPLTTVRSLTAAAGEAS